MPLPGITINVGDRGPSAPAPDDVGGLAAAVLSERGPVGEIITCQSWAQARNIVGDHTSYSNTRTFEQYFRQGGTRLRLVRVVGPAAASASTALRDASAGTVMTITAGGPGDYGNGYAATVITGTGSVRTILVREDGDDLFSGTFATSLDAKAALEAAGFTVALGAAAWPPVVASSQAFAGGTDDRMHITDVEVTAAIDVIDDFQPESLAAPGWTTPQVHSVLANRANALNKFALGTLPDVATVGTLTALAVQMRGIVADAPYIQLLAGWPQINVAGVALAIDPAGVHAGRMARADRENGPGPGQPTAWSFGIYDQSIVGVSQAWSDVDRETLNDAGITVIRNVNGDVYADDALTLADPVLYQQYSEVAGMRVLMAVKNQAGQAMSKRVMQLIDGKGRLLASVAADITGICQSWYQRDALYGETPVEAFLVDTGPGVNPSAQLATRRIAAHLELRTSPSAQRVELDITKVASGDTI